MVYSEVGFDPIIRMRSPRLVSTPNHTPARELKLPSTQAKVLTNCCDCDFQPYNNLASFPGRMGGKWPGIDHLRMSTLPRKTWELVYICKQSVISTYMSDSLLYH